VTDGQDFASREAGAMVDSLDNLIADGQIKPLIAVFIDPRDPATGRNRRDQELVANSLDECPFCDFVALELVPAIDASYKTDLSPNKRALLGFSYGGMFTAHMGLVHADVFNNLAVLSPYIMGEWIFDNLGQRLPLNIFLSHGTYDPGASSLRLHDVLEEKGYPVLYVETHEGHTYAAVRGLMDNLLMYFFGTG
jgi:enterochelin esterase family protein